MLSKTDYSIIYATAFAVQAQIESFLVDFGVKRGWALLAKLLRIRFDSAFTAFLDAPSPKTLAEVIAFEAEMVRLGDTMKGARADWV
jgi:hypothetical protein